MLKYKAKMFVASTEPPVEILKTETGVSLVAPDFGIENINYDQGNVQVLTLCIFYIFVFPQTVS